MGLVSRAQSLWHGLRKRAVVEKDMSDEFANHIELRAADLVRQGVMPDEAHRRARLEFGSSERFKDEGRAARGLRTTDNVRFSWLDFKLGFRMLAKYPVLTLVAGFAMAFAICVGVGAFEFINQLVNPRLPLVGGERLVAIRNWDLKLNQTEPRALRDYAEWKRQLRTVESFGAWREVDRNLILGDGLGEPVDHVEMSASGFRLAAVPPLLGRTLVDADEAPDAPAVLVIGHDLWQTRFGSDSGVIGKTVTLGGEPVEIVGVMPEGFSFPVAHNAWRPFRLDALDYEPVQGPSINVFGRLAPSVRLAEAQREIELLGQRAATATPETHEFLRPQVVPYAKSFLDIGGWASAGLMVSGNLVLVLLLLLICSNVALLLFARAATRESEIIVRSALGASRRRIVVQLFSEALVLGGVASLVGLAAVSYGIRLGLRLVEGELMDGGRMPFWFDGRLSPSTIVYAILLTILTAVVTGVVPALRITRDLSHRLKEVTAGGGGVRFGGVWTAIIVAQVAITVVFPSVGFFVGRDVVKIREHDVGFNTGEFLSFELQMDRVAPGDTALDSFLARFATAGRDLEQRLDELPAIRGVTVANNLPRIYHGWNQFEVEGEAEVPKDARGHRGGSANVDLDYFDVLGTPLLAGRPFNSGDVAEGARTVIVNKPFVDRVLGGRNAIGRRIRYVAREGHRPDVAQRNQPDLGRGPSSDGPWYEIVGVSRDLGTTSGYGRIGVYHPIARDQQYPVRFAMRVTGDPDALVPEIRKLAAQVDPTLRVSAPMSLTDVVNDELRFYSFWIGMIQIVSAIALLLSLAGIYAVTSYIVSRRTREIGVRVALGANGRQIITSILRRPLLQVALGILIGTMITGLLSGTVSVEAVRSGAAASILMRLGAVVLYGVFMLAVCLLACIVPTRRALSVQPTDALRTD
jgi:putative ABC transport system permease protein